MSEPLHGSPSFTTAAPGHRLWKGAIIALLDLRSRLKRHRERHRLMEMEPRLLRDVGLDRRTAAREARKWWWQA